MAFSTFPNNPFPPSTAQFNEGKNDAIQAEIDAIKDGSTIDSFSDVETALASLESSLTNLVKVYHASGTTDSVGDFIFNVPNDGTPIYVRPLRDSEYYNSWWGVILASTGNNVGYSAKAIKDDNTALTSQAVKFDVYYI